MENSTIIRRPKQAEMQYSMSDPQGTNLLLSWWLPKAHENKRSLVSLVLWSQAPLPWQQNSDLSLSFYASLFWYLILSQQMQAMTSHKNPFLYQVLI